MKKEKDIVEFFNRYSDQMLPTDGEHFMEKLKHNMDLLPVPSAFSRIDSEMSKEYAEWFLGRLKKDYKRSRRDAVISCIFISIIIATVLFVINILGVLDINIVVTIGVLAVVALAFIILLFSLFPLYSKGTI